jgi:hypothetical protein
MTVLSALHDDVDMLSGWVQPQLSQVDWSCWRSTATAMHWSLSSFTTLIGIASLGVLWSLGSFVYYRYLSPISDIPGPFLASFSRLWLVGSIVRGKCPVELSGLHDKHGK